jgi:hypothetical protein
MVAFSGTSTVAESATDVECGKSELRQWDGEYVDHADFDSDVDGNSSSGGEFGDD